MSRRKRQALAVFVLLLIVLFTIIYILPNITGALTQTSIIEYGSIQVSDEVTAYFVRDERMYLANQTGTINYYVAEGEQVRKGVKVLDISLGAVSEEERGYSAITSRIEQFNGGESIFSDDLKRMNLQLEKLAREKEEALAKKETKTAEKLEKQTIRLIQKKAYIEATDAAAKEEVKKQHTAVNEQGVIPESYVSESNGVICYYVDGYESEFTPQNMAMLSRKKVENSKFDIQNLVRTTTLAKEPLYKIVDNNQWFVVFWIAPEQIVKYEKDKTVYLNLPLGQVEGKIHDIIDDDGFWMVILSFNRYYEEFARIRKVQAEVITSEYKGLTIRNESITQEDGKTGVYVKDKRGEFVFKPVKVITTDGVWSLVEVSSFSDENGEKVNTVNIYDEILRRPN